VRSTQGSDKKFVNEKSEILTEKIRLQRPMADGRVMLKWSQRTLYVPYPCIKRYLRYV